jgi:hypothetical protein
MRARRPREDLELEMQEDPGGLGVTDLEPPRSAP